MCGRVFIKSTLADLIANFAAVNSEALGNLQATYNGSPGRDYPIIVRDDASIYGAFIVARWGFVPAWAKDPIKVRSANARAESIAEKSMFLSAYRSRRGIMPIDGYFEWRSTVPPKQPYAIAMRSDKPFGVAVIWEERREPDETRTTKTFAVVTCAPNELLAPIHDRMPVILAPEDYAEWLGPHPDPRHLMRPFPSELMKIWPVSSRVNRTVKPDKTPNDSPDLIDPEEPDKPLL